MIRNTIIFLSLCYNLVALSDEQKPFEIGDCFKYEDFSNSDRFNVVIGRIDEFHFGTFDYKGILFGKLKKSDQFIKFKFELPYRKQYKYKTIKCPNVIKYREKF